MYNFDPKYKIRFIMTMPQMCVTAPPEVSVVAWSQAVACVTSSCLGEHVKLVVLRLISLRSCQIAAPSDYESKEIKTYV